MFEVKKCYCFMFLCLKFNFYLTEKNQLDTSSMKASNLTGTVNIQISLCYRVLINTKKNIFFSCFI